MGPYATSKTVFAMVKNVLQGHNYEVEGEGNEISSPTKTLSTMRSAEIRRCHSSKKCVITAGRLDNCLEKASAKITPLQPSSVQHPFNSHGRGTTSSLLQKAGMVSSFVGVQLCTLSEIYIKLSDAAQSEKVLSAQHIHRFICWGMKTAPSLAQEKILMSGSLAREFEDKVKKIFMPNTLKNHASSILELIKLCATKRELRDAFPPTNRTALNKARDEWLRIKRESEKQARRVQKRKLMTTVLPEAPIFWTLAYLRQLRTTEDMSNCLEAVKRGIATPRQTNTIVCAICCILALHGQRKCVADNMKLSELQSATSKRGRLIIRVEKHKSTLNSGPANIALRQDQYNLMLNYGTLRCKTPEDFVVRTPDGKLLPRPFEPLLEYVRARSFSTESISFNSFRKTIETGKKFSVGSLTDNECDMIHNYLKHGKRVTKLHYEFQTPEVVVQGAEQVESTLFQVAFFQAVESNALPGILPENALGKSL